MRIAFCLAILVAGSFGGVIRKLKFTSFSITRQKKPNVCTSQMIGLYLAQPLEGNSGQLKKDLLLNLRKPNTRLGKSPAEAGLALPVLVLLSVRRVPSGRAPPVGVRGHRLPPTRSGRREPGGHNGEQEVAGPKDPSGVDSTAGARNGVLQVADPKIPEEVGL